MSLDAVLIRPIMQRGMLCKLLAIKQKFQFFILPKIFQIQWTMQVSAGVKVEPQQKTSPKI